MGILSGDVSFRLINAVDARLRVYLQPNRLVITRGEIKTRNAAETERDGFVRPAGRSAPGVNNVSQRRT